jgi:hypothetical protein
MIVKMMEMVGEDLTEGKKSRPMFNGTTCSTFFADFLKERKPQNK